MFLLCLHRKAFSLSLWHPAWHYSCCCREILFKQIFDTVLSLCGNCFVLMFWLLILRDRLIDRWWCHRHGLFTPGMWWCLVAAKFGLAAWCDSVQKDLCLCSQRQHSKHLSKSAHITLLCLWKSQTDYVPMILCGSTLNNSQDIWVQVLLSLHFSNTWILLMQYLLH